MNEFRFICARLILDERILKILSVTERHTKLKGKRYKQNTPPKSYKTEIKILANPGLA